MFLTHASEVYAYSVTSKNGLHELKRLKNDNKNKYTTWTSSTLKIEGVKV